MKKKRNRRNGRATQNESIFYQLYVRVRAKDTEFVPVYAVMGEVYLKELSKWGYISYECSSRFSQMFKDNPGLFERRKLKGKSGASYYGYRFSPGATREMVKDPALRLFYDELRHRWDLIHGRTQRIKEQEAKEEQKREEPKEEVVAGERPPVSPDAWYLRD